LLQQQHWLSNEQAQISAGGAEVEAGGLNPLPEPPLTLTTADE